MLAQPQLGKYLVELRKKNNLTQEELVERCNVSVRTIQRIESGEVTPRSSTVKILLEALDYDREEWVKLSNAQEKEVEESFFSLLAGLYRYENGMEQSRKNLKVAWIVGIVSLVVSASLYSYLLLKTIHDVGRIIRHQEKTDFLFSDETMIIPGIIFGLISIGHQKGFLSLGVIFENNKLKMTSKLLIALNLLSIPIHLFILFTNPGDTFNTMFSLFYMLLMGAVVIPFGLSLMSLQDSMGNIAKITGKLEIALGIIFLSVILSPLIFFVIFPVITLEIMLLYKASELVKAGKL